MDEEVIGILRGRAADGRFDSDARIGAWTSCTGGSSCGSGMRALYVCGLCECRTAHP